jgi:DNA helicase II / ATP-dependent DNA helicase PcrA
MSEMLNKEQQDAVNHLDGPLLVLAGAGSGKTRVVTNRIISLLDKGVLPHNIVAVTFTNKAADEMKERVRRLSYRDITICTFHSLGLKILRQSITALGYGSDFTIYDEEDSIKVIRACMQELGIDTKETKPKVFKHAISTAKNKLLSCEDLAAEENIESDKDRIAARIYEMYQKKLMESSALDFDDLLFLPVRLFRENPSILAYYQDMWRYLLIDEYQDTNPAQYALASLLVAKSRNIFAVGDPDQSIYSWRGADVKNILSFDSDYPGAKIVYLEQNYRSTSTILDAANAVIQRNENRYEKNLWSDCGAGEKIRLHEAETDRKEAVFVLEEVCDMHHGDSVSLSDMVIFYRTNAQSRIFEDYLLKNRIPYVIVGGVSFYQRREIKDILAYLRVIYSGADVIAFMRSINLPKRGLGATTLTNIQRAASAAGMPVLEYCKHVVATGSKEVRLSSRQRTGLEEYVALIEKLRNRAEVESISEIMTNVIDESGYIAYLRGDDPETFDDRKENVDQLITKAYEWEQECDADASLGTFLEELSLRTTLDEASSPDDRISLMTVHNGKGLEFDVTFLVGLEEELFPHANSYGSFEAIEEERRLFYVGMTRAKRRLYLTSAKYRYIWRELQYMQKSRFLNEVPLRYIKRVRSHAYV